MNKIDAAVISDRLIERIYPHFDQSCKEHVENFTATIPKSKISLNNKNHENKLIEFFIIFSELQYLIKGPKSERLFDNFSRTGIATILSVHFERYKNNRINSVQKNVNRVYENMNERSPKVAKLNQARSEYFYES